MEREVRNADRRSALKSRLTNTNSIGGGLVALVGLFVFVDAFELRIGSLTSMGPGYFPRLLGAATIAVGALNMFVGVSQTRSLAAIPWRPLIAILASISTFALLIRTVGLGPAAFCTAVISSFADRDSRFVQTLLLAAFLVGFSWLIFVKILGLPIALIRMPVL